MFDSKDPNWNPEHAERVIDCAVEIAEFFSTYEGDDGINDSENIIYKYFPFTPPTDTSKEPIFFGLTCEHNKEVINCKICRPIRDFTSKDDSERGEG